MMALRTTTTTARARNDEAARAAREAVAWAVRWRDVGYAIGETMGTPVDPGDPNHVAIVAMCALMWALRESPDLAHAVVESDQAVPEIVNELVASFRRGKDRDVVRFSGRPFGVPSWPSTVWRPYGLGVFRRPRWWSGNPTWGEA